MGAAFALSARRVLAAPAELVVSALFYLIVVGALSAVWRTAAAANGGHLVGYSAAALTWYIATSESAVVSLDIRMIGDLGEDIASGSVAVELLRPVSVLWIRVAAQLGRAAARLLVIAPAGVALATVTGGRPPDGAALALALPSVGLALVANVVAQHAFAASAFWLRNATTAWFLYHKLVFVLGGMLIPLEVFPGWLEAAARALPFQAMAYAPARLASGHLEPLLLVEQLGWIAVLSAVASAVFSAGERRLQVVGG